MAILTRGYKWTDQPTTDFAIYRAPTAAKNEQYTKLHSFHLNSLCVLNKIDFNETQQPKQLLG